MLLAGRPRVCPGGGIDSEEPLWLLWTGQGALLPGEGLASVICWVVSKLNEWRSCRGHLLPEGPVSSGKGDTLLVSEALALELAKKPL